MQIKNFPELLTGVLQGDGTAFGEWETYTLNSCFQPEEIQQTLTAINEILLSQQNHPQRGHALYLRAYMHNRGLGGPVNLAESINYLIEAVSLNHSGAMNDLAFHYSFTIGIPTNYNEAIRLNEMAIALECDSAMHNRAYVGPGRTR